MSEITREDVQGLKAISKLLLDMDAAASAAWCQDLADKLESRLPKDPAMVQVAQLMYKHVGKRAPQVEDLARFVHDRPYDEVLEEARKLGKVRMAEFNEKEILGWDVRVVTRPQ